MTSRSSAGGRMGSDSTRYRYLWSETVYIGAQEVALVHPDAVVRGALDGYLRVNYARLGLQLMTLPEWQARSEGERL